MKCMGGTVHLGVEQGAALRSSLTLQAGRAQLWSPRRLWAEGRQMRCSSGRVLLGDTCVKPQQLAKKWAGRMQGGKHLLHYISKYFPAEKERKPFGHHLQKKG